MPTTTNFELANQRATLRKMLGHADWADDTTDNLQTLEDNVSLFTPELLDRINQEVVRAGHALVKTSPDDSLAVRCDSFVVETHVHYPTDINLLYDAVRKAIQTSAGLCEDAGPSDWRQSAYNVRCLTKAYRRAQPLKRSTAKDPQIRAARRTDIEAAHAAYLELAEGFTAAGARDPHPPVPRTIDAVLASAGTLLANLFQNVLHQSIRDIKLGPVPIESAARRSPPSG